MAIYRRALPQLRGEPFLTDGGLETTLLFHEGFEFPDFAAFVLLHSQKGKAGLLGYFGTYAKLAERFSTGLILESPTWRANREWGEKLGYTPEALAEANREAIRLLGTVRDLLAHESTTTVISGCIGPRGDGYRQDRKMSEQEAQDYHEEQISTFAKTDADLVTGMTMNYVEEALGIVRAAREARMPVVISFTLETDGALASGQSLGEAIRQVDGATGAYPAYYMINCAHPDHFRNVVQEGGDWSARIQGLRANASRRSHAELDNSTELDSGDPDELGEAYRQIKEAWPQLNVFGGCCGTDHRHVEKIALVCRPFF